MVHGLETMERLNEEACCGENHSLAPKTCVQMTYGEGVLYVLDTLGSIWTLHFDSGEPRWSRITQEPEEVEVPEAVDSLVVHDGNLYALGACGEVYRIRDLPEENQVVWEKMTAG